MTNEGIWGVNWQMGTLCHSNKQTLKLLKKKKKGTRKRRKIQRRRNYRLLEGKNGRGKGQCWPLHQSETSLASVENLCRSTGGFFSYRFYCHLLENCQECSKCTLPWHPSGHNILLQHAICTLKSRNQCLGQLHHMPHTCWALPLHHHLIRTTV